MGYSSVSHSSTGLRFVCAFHIFSMPDCKTLAEVGRNERVRVGITYDLREDYLARGYSEIETAEFDHPDTIEAIDEALQGLGYRTDRIGHIRNLVERLAGGDSWDMVFNIAEGIRGYARESQVPALLEAYDIPYTFSDPLTLSLALHKGMAKRIVRGCGIPTPEFEIVTCEADTAALRLPFPLFAKPVAEGTGKGITDSSLIRTKKDLDMVVRRLLFEFEQPVLVESFLPGREFTVGIVGTGRDAVVLGVMEIILKDSAEMNAYSYHNKENWENLVDYRLLEDASEAKEVALAAWRALGCRDAGRVDIRADARGVPNFLEVNPLAGLRPGYSDLPILCEILKIPYRELIGMIMRSAERRLKGAR